jgi:hypothetical protein
VAKRVRNRSAHRPGGQGPSRTNNTSSSSDSEVDDSVDIDAAVESVGMETTELVIEEPATPTTTAASKPRRTRRGAKAKADSLEVRSAAEGVFVREDLRRIGIITAVLVVALLTAWVVLVPMNALGLY